MVETSRNTQWLPISGDAAALGSGEAAVGDGFSLPLRALIHALRGAALPAEISRAMNAADWQRFQSLACHLHRVGPGLPAEFRALLPREVAQALAENARAAAMAGLSQKAESQRVAAVLADAGIDCVFLKGWPLAERLFGGAHNRHAKDLDILVRPQQAASAWGVLAKLGYRPTAAHRGAEHLLSHPRFLAECNDLELARDAPPLQLELHWRSQHFPGGPDLADLIWREDRRVRWPLGRAEGHVIVPDDRANLIYLALHGESHIWLRLKWLHDVARLISERSEAELRDDLALARSISAESAVVVAGHLVARLFGVALPQFWPAPTARERMALRYVLGHLRRETVPGSFRAKCAFYIYGLLRAQGGAALLGVLRYAFWRRAVLAFEAMRARRR